MIRVETLLGNRNEPSRAQAHVYHSHIGTPLLTQHINTQSFRCPFSGPTVYQLRVHHYLLRVCVILLIGTHWYTKRTLNYLVINILYIYVCTNSYVIHARKYGHVYAMKSNIQSNTIHNRGKERVHISADYDL